MGESLEEEILSASCVGHSLGEECPSEESYNIMAAWGRRVWTIEIVMTVCS